jgi:hypothetical protein
MGEKEGELLRAACVTLKDIADAVDVPHTTVRNWAAGRVEIPQEIRPTLAAFLERRGGELQALATELRKEAGG